jgi:hypothetical protein
MLTRFRNRDSILTEWALNKLYGGLYGTDAGAEYEADDPLNAGHIHDGTHDDGHAQKINLANHVVGELDGVMIQDASIPLSKISDELYVTVNQAPDDGNFAVDGDANRKFFVFKADNVAVSSLSTFSQNLFYISNNTTTSCSVRVIIFDTATNQSVVYTGNGYTTNIGGIILSGGSLTFEYGSGILMAKLEPEGGSINFDTSTYFKLEIASDSTLNLRIVISVETLTLGFNDL